MFSALPRRTYTVDDLRKLHERFYHRERGALSSAFLGCAKARRPGGRPGPVMEPGSGRQPPTAASRHLSISTFIFSKSKYGLGQTRTQATWHREAQLADIGPTASTKHCLYPGRQWIQAKRGEAGRIASVLPAQLSRVGSLGFTMLFLSLSFFLSFFFINVSLGL